MKLKISQSEDEQNWSLVDLTDIKQISKMASSGHHIIRINNMDYCKVRFFSLDIF